MTLHATEVRDGSSARCFAEVATSDGLRGRRSLKRTLFSKSE
jgi:hypothetical protein